MLRLPRRLLAAARRLHQSWQQWALAVQQGVLAKLQKRHAKDHGKSLKARIAAALLGVANKVATHAKHEAWRAWLLGTVVPSREAALAAAHRAEVDDLRLVSTLDHPAALEVGTNEIGDVGMAAFGQAIKPVSEGGSGALADCEVLWLSNNKIGNKGLEAFSTALATGAMANCHTLRLGGNRIGDVGITAFAEAIKPVSQGGSGALAQCTRLSLRDNKIGDKGLEALSGALAMGSLPKLEKLYVDGEHPALQAAPRLVHDRAQRLVRLGAPPLLALEPLEPSLGPVQPARRLPGLRAGLTMELP